MDRKFGTATPARLDLRVVRLCKVYLPDEVAFRTAQQFDIGRFTVLFGKNNAGKTTILDYIYLMFARRAPEAGEARLRGADSSTSADKQIGYNVGAAYVELEPEFAFDRAVLSAFPQWEPAEAGAIRFEILPPRQVCYSSVYNSPKPELWFTDVREFYEGILQEIYDAPGGVDVDYELDEQQRSEDGPFPKPLLLGWEAHGINTWVTAAVGELVEQRIRQARPGYDHWLEWMDTGDDEEFTYRVRPEVIGCVKQLAALATDLLPDFLDGEVRAFFHIPKGWDEAPAIELNYRDRGRLDRIESFGRGASRWIGIAVQVALRIMRGDSAITALDPAVVGRFSGQVLFVDEPEAHLHHSAVASVVRWCSRMVRSGFNVVAASHHEEFLRASGEEVTFVKVTREKGHSAARTITTTATSTLQELADEIGMHPGAALSLHRAILFVEGPLDEAVLDEFAGGALDAAGVTIIPIHGTKNLEGLIDGEFTARLGIKTGVLTDNTNTASMWDRSNNKRKQEEKKVVRLIQRFEDQGLLPPKPFGVIEDDLLFALPAEAIGSYIGGNFPGWHELREECRAAEGRGMSESVDWKKYALEQYRLPITTADGVRRIVRSLDLSGVELPSIRNVVDEVIAWAKEP